jgi:hypothetical protein
MKKALVIIIGLIGIVCLLSINVNFCNKSKPKVYRATEIIIDREYVLEQDDRLAFNEASRTLCIVHADGTTTQIGKELK